MRTVLATIACVVLVACTGGSEPGPGVDAIVSADPDPEPRDTPDPATTLDPGVACEGLGRAPRSGQITLIEDRELRAYTSSGGPPVCLLDLEAPALYGNVTAPSWNARGSAVILRDRAISKDGSVTIRLTDRQRETPVWSRPEGTSVVYVTTQGVLKKRSSFGGKASDISFLEHHDAVTYHPAGLHIASSGRAEDGSYGLYLATNLGTEPQLLARGEEANLITDLTFSEDGRWLYFVARHGETDWHLHRLGMSSEGTLETLTTAENQLEYAVSPFNSDLFAWGDPGDCAAGGPGPFHVSDSRFVVPDALRSGRIEPVGWLRGSKLVVRAGMGGCGTASPGAVYVLSHQDPVLVHEENYGNVSVRVRYPPPPPPPGEEPEVVA